MSAWVVDRAHIDALVLAGMQWGTLPRDERLTPREVMTVVGRALWAENLASVAHRYPGDSDGQRPGPIDFVDEDPQTYTAPVAEVVLSAPAVVKAIDCLDYQSCEHPGWRQSVACGYLILLRQAILDTFPTDQLHTSPHGGTELYPPGYDDAPWGVSDLAEVAAH